MQKTSNGIIIGNTRVFPTNSTKKKRPRKQRGYHIACVCATVAYAVLITLIICTATILIYKFTRDKLSISNGSTTQSAQTISSSTAFTTKISTIVPTTPIVCENLGAYDANLQQCICFAGFSGSKCEIPPDCNLLPNDDPTCVFIMQDQTITDDIKKGLCPKSFLCVPLETYRITPITIQSQTINKTEPRKNKKCTDKRKYSICCVLASILYVIILLGIIFTAIILGITLSKDKSNDKLPTTNKLSTISSKDTSTSIQSTSILTTTTITTTTTLIETTAFFCSNLGMIDSSGIRCECRYGFTGRHCEIFIGCINIVQEDDPICEFIVGDPTVEEDIKRAFCPKTWFCPSS